MTIENYVNNSAQKPGVVNTRAPEISLKISASSIDGKVRDFYWWRNFEFGNLRSTAGLYRAAFCLAELKYSYAVDAAIGMPFDLDEKHLEIRRATKKGVYGVYLNANKFPDRDHSELTGNTVEYDMGFHYCTFRVMVAAGFKVLPGKKGTQFSDVRFAGLFLKAKAAILKSKK